MLNGIISTNLKYLVVFFQLNPNEFINMDTILEEVMHRLVILPLRSHVTNLFRVDFERTGCLRLLEDKMEMVRREIGTHRHHVSPNLSETIRNEFPTTNLGSVMLVCKKAFKDMETSFSPAVKLKYLLDALKSIMCTVNNSLHFSSNRLDPLPKALYESLEFRLRIRTRILDCKLMKKKRPLNYPVPNNNLYKLH